MANRNSQLPSLNVDTFQRRMGVIRRQLAHGHIDYPSKLEDWRRRMENALSGHDIPMPEAKVVDGFYEGCYLKYSSPAFRISHRARLEERLEQFKARVFNYFEDDEDVFYVAGNSKWDVIGMFDYGAVQIEGTMYKPQLIPFVASFHRPPPPTSRYTFSVGPCTLPQETFGKLLDGIIPGTGVSKRNEHEYVIVAPSPEAVTMLQLLCHAWAPAGLPMRAFHTHGLDPDETEARSRWNPLKKKAKQTKAVPQSKAADCVISTFSRSSHSAREGAFPDDATENVIETVASRAKPVATMSPLLSLTQPNQIPTATQSGYAASSSDEEHTALKCERSDDERTAREFDTDSSHASRDYTFYNGKKVQGRAFANTFEMDYEDAKKHSTPIGR